MSERLSRVNTCELDAEIIKSRSLWGLVLIGALKGSINSLATLSVVVLALPCSP